LLDNALDIGLYNSLSRLARQVQAVLTVWTVVSCSNNFSTKLGSGWLGYGRT